MWRWYFSLLENSQRYGIAWWIQKLLLVFSLFYQAGIRLRLLGYRWGVLNIYRVPIKVVSVGNLTAGGTGKTPFVEWLAKALQKFLPSDYICLLSRGYKQLDSGVNDEYLLLQQNLPSIAHFTGKDRVALAKTAYEQGYRLAILDDGFQHIRLQRDLNILLLDATNPFGYGKCLPAGLLREPMYAIQRADVVILTRVELCPPTSLAQLEETVLTYKALPIFWLKFSLRRCYELFRGTAYTLDSLPPLFAFCAIGNPRSFLLLLEHYQITPLGCQIYPDHHIYSQKDLDKLIQQAQRAGAKGLLTTQKDAVKIQFLRSSFPVYVFELEADLVKGEETFQSILRSLCSSDR
ncbi:MAG: tetraacyldisaccharide 4'-kinase [Planctomycetota bacterium]|nr:MAG: tetraacyldisaccharide 4'-kinase [Planctomycetota bacterium]